MTSIYEIKKEISTYEKWKEATEYLDRVSTLTVKLDALGRHDEATAIRAVLTGHFEWVL